MLKGFRDFISRGSVVDLAVGVVIGAAFTEVVKGFTTSFLTPLINLIGGANIAGEIDLPGEGAITWGAFLSTVIGFMITAAVVYFLVVVPMNRLAAMRKRGQVNEPEAPSEEIRLLMEIRDALVAQRKAPEEPAKESVRQRAAQ
ncbi:large-conductance mechanosensitive channel [Rhizocola hellebori]|uniref:Large-conductance mechanosensitive channel n=1 Tax=Rhizocola hellebori TaxID=1392758 RepID=A0A8J3QDN1_9ACTN|nr:large conductance mechanosensitive channel protein MscL [Rhizocola hellebori]GIH08776.1 large-conductance mechanosensitive channel [Rhizocola hellebori]